YVWMTHWCQAHHTVPFCVQLTSANDSSTLGVFLTLLTSSVRRLRVRYPSNPVKKASKVSQPLAVPASV
ncbi:MAG: hypothetical protein OEZ57_16730, partial [Nitrospirota bacterium]|nr:hypothetical protein [Nitrospirota bacterium]